MRDIEKQKAWKRRKRDEIMAAKYGPEAIGKNMIGRHGKHARGESNSNHDTTHPKTRIASRSRP